MPRTLLVAMTLALLPAAAHAQAPAGTFHSDNVEFVRNVATGPSSGAKLVGGFFYLTTGRDLQIYDVKDPESPVRVGSVSFPTPGAGEQRAPEEDPDTNGRILITTNGGRLQVFDVADKTAPRVLSELSGITQHTISCVLDCTWGYGSDGVIVDLRDPKSPKEAGDWHGETELGSAHDVTEVAPGIVLTSSQPIKLLDARRNPAKPTVLAEAQPPGFVHANLWPSQAQDPFMLAGGEAQGPACEASKSSTFMTWDTAGWQSTRSFKLIDEFSMTAGTPAGGSFPTTTFCTHWFDAHPAFFGGGLVGIGWYEQGTRFLRVGTDGKIEEIGYFLPYGGRSSALYWVSDRVAYVADYYRGLDVLRWTSDIPTGRARPGAPAVGSSPATPPATPGPRTSSGTPVSFDDLVRLPSTRRCTTRRKFRIAVRRSPDPVNSLALRVNGKRAGTFRGAKLRRPITLRRLPKRKLTVQVAVRTRSGHTTAGTRSYRVC